LLTVHFYNPPCYKHQTEEINNPSNLHESKDQPNPLERSQPNKKYGFAFRSRSSTGDPKTIIEVKMDVMNGVVDPTSIDREYCYTYTPEKPDNWTSSIDYHRYSQKIKGSQIVWHKRLIFRRRQ